MLLGHTIRYHQANSPRYRLYTSQSTQSHEDSDNGRARLQKTHSSSSNDTSTSKSSSEQTKTGWSSSSETLPPDWEDNADLNITRFSDLPHREFGYNQHMIINEEFKECLRQVLWKFRAPIRYAFAYGSGVFPQSSAEASPADMSPHPRAPEAIKKWQKGGGKMIDFIFGVSHTEHWHSLNLAQLREHYSGLGSLGSGIVSRVQDNWGAGVYFNPYITVNGTLIKYGVANIDTIRADLSEWQTLYIAGRLHKPVKILRDDPRVRVANQINLISALRTGLLLLGENFTEPELFTTVASLSYLGDPRMQLGSEHPGKVGNIVANQLSSFRQLYLPLIENLPNVSYTDRRCNQPAWADDPAITKTTVSTKNNNVNHKVQALAMQQDMHPQKRANMVRRLPLAFRHRLYSAYQAHFGINGRDFAAMVADAADEDAESGTLSRRQAGPFERRIVTDDRARLVETVRTVIKKTVQWPSTSQTAKGLVTAGWSRTRRYLREKAEKNRMGRAGAKG